MSAVKKKKKILEWKVKFQPRSTWMSIFSGPIFHSEKACCLRPTIRLVRLALRCWQRGFIGSTLFTGKVKPEFNSTSVAQLHEQQIRSYSKKSQLHYNYTYKQQTYQL